MFFLARSAFCITLVVLALPTPPHRADLTGAAGMAAMSTLRDLCRADPGRCLSFMRDEVSTALAGAAPKARPAQAIRPAVDTLLPEDFDHAWAGPARPLRS